MKNPFPDTPRAFVLALALLLLITASMFWTRYSATDAMEARHRIVDVRMELSHFKSDLLQMGRATGAYVYTRQTTLLSDYHRASTAAYQRLERIAALTANQEELGAPLQVLRAELDAIETLFKRLHRTAAGQGEPSVAGMDGSGPFLAAAQTLEQIDATQKELLDRRDAAARQRSDLATGTLLAGALASLLLFALGGREWTRSLRSLSEQARWLARAREEQALAHQGLERLRLRLEEANEMLRAQASHVAELNKALWASVDGGGEAEGGAHGQEHGQEAAGTALDDPARLAALMASALMDSPAEPVLDRLVRSTAASLHVPMCLISLLDDRRQFFKSAVGLPQPWMSRRETPLSHSLCRHVVTSGRPLMVEDATREPALRHNGAVRDLGVTAYLGVPLRTRDGHVLGSICAMDTRRRRWRSDDLVLLSYVADSILASLAVRVQMQSLEHRVEQRTTEVRASEQRFRTLADSVQAMVWEGAAAGPGETPCGPPARYFNQRWYDYTGQTAAQARGDGWCRALHPEDAERVCATLARACERGQATELEYRCRRHDGQWRWHLERVHPLRGEGGEIGGWIGTSVDVHDLRQSRQRHQYLLALEDELRLAATSRDVLDSACAAIGRALGAQLVGWSELQEDGEHTIVESAWRGDGGPPLPGRYPLSALGLPRLAPLLLGEALVVEDVLTDARTRDDPASLDLYANAQARSTLELPLMREGRLHAILFIGAAQPRAWTHTELTLARDTVERTWHAAGRVRAEKHLAEREVQARQTAAMLDRVIETLPGPIWARDAAGYFTLANSAAAQVLGLQRTDLVGRHGNELFPHEFASTLDEESQRVLQGESIELARTLFHRSAGEPRHYHITKLPMRDVEGRINGMLGVALDVTRRRQAEEALHASQRELSQLAQRLMEQERTTTQHLAQVLHDGLGQTLGAMRLHMDMLDAAGALPALPAAQQPHLQRLRELGHQSVTEVRTALMELRPPMLQEQGLVAALDYHLGLRRHEAAGVALGIAADPALLGQRWPAKVEYAFFMVAREAINNAVLHAGAGRIECVVEGQAQWLRLYVRDDGCGIPADVQRPGHLGVVGMRERALAIGATLSIRPRLQGGTSVQLEWESTEDGAEDGAGEGAEDGVKDGLEGGAGRAA